ncbi:MAG: BREX-2 system adenine-specific DNA-methyltransferase PglX [Actinomycetota bacterium]
MIHRPTLVTDLQRLLRTLEADLLERVDAAEAPEVGQALRAEYDAARRAERTAQSFEEWLGDQRTQVAAAWVLSAVFVRFLEDNRLIEPPRLSGPGERLARARDQHELYFRAHPGETDREYLLAAFDALAAVPSTAELFGPHNALRRLPRWLSGDAAGDLLRFFQKISPESGELVHDFTDPEWNTRFLGDLYQDLSEAARKKYALLQTPEFVEEFILDRTLEPAIQEFGLEGPDGKGFRMIDPACGSGHFLLGAFHRLLDHWQRREPAANARVLVQRALVCVHGVDLNPYAVAVARFRLLLAAMKAAGITRLADAPNFAVKLACGDSLLHRGQHGLALESEDQHAYWTEDLPLLQELLVPGRYHTVAANPPYITPKDPAQGLRYRREYSSCHMKYSLSVPFMERIFGLAVSGGFTGQITANSFMKREFGKKLIEGFLPTVDLTHVIDTSGAYIPGHGTPTVILFGRARRPVGKFVRAVLGIRGEPATPAEGRLGKVWKSILEQVDQPASVSDFVSSTDAPREAFLRHPWSIGGGGAADLKELLERNSSVRLGELATDIGFASFPAADDVFVADLASWHRRSIPAHLVHPFVYGELVKDYAIAADAYAMAPYDDNYELLPYVRSEKWCDYLWSRRVHLENIILFGGKTRAEMGHSWWGWYRWIAARYRVPLSIVFAHVASHNHFVADEGGRVFNQHAPVIKLRDTDVVLHEKMTAILNCSAACFWMKQVFFPKGGDHVGGEGARVRRTWWDERYEFAGMGLEKFPIPRSLPGPLAESISCIAKNDLVASPPRLRATELADLDACARDRAISQCRLVALQEELDWECYRLYKLIEDDLAIPEPPPIQQGQRAFEIVMARKMAAGELETTWFQRHGSTPITEIPTEWPGEYRRLVQRRIEVIESDPNIALIEQPEYKRRWNTEPWESQLQRALKSWLLDRLESYFDLDGRMNEAGTPTARFEAEVVSMARLADVARADAEFVQVGELYRKDPTFDVTSLVDELVRGDSVPLLPVLRYKETGLRKRAEWERTWELQRAEDRIEAEVRRVLAEAGLNPEERTPVPYRQVEETITSLEFERAYWGDQEPLPGRRPPAAERP